MNLIRNSNTFMAEAKDCVHSNLVANIGEYTISSDPNIIPFLAERYLNLFQIRETPSKQVLLEYLTDESLTKKSFSPDKAAIACEFWAGIFFKHIENKKEPLSVSDYDNTLELAYALLATHTGIYSFASSSEVADKVLLSFRKTSLELKIPTSENNFEERVLRLIH